MAQGKNILTGLNVDGSKISNLGSENAEEHAPNHDFWRVGEMFALKEPFCGCLARNSDVLLVLRSSPMVMRDEIILHPKQIIVLAAVRLMREQFKMGTIRTTRKTFHFVIPNGRMYEIAPAWLNEVTPDSD